MILDPEGLEHADDLTFYILQFYADTQMSCVLSHHTYTALSYTR